MTYCAVNIECTAFAYAADGSAYGFYGTRAVRLNTEGAAQQIFDADATNGAFSHYIKRVAFSGTNQLVFALENGTVIAVTRGGAELWRTTLASPSIAQLAVGNDGQIYALGTDNQTQPTTRVYTINPDGQQRVLFERAGSQITAMNLRDHRLYLSIKSSGIQAVNVSSASLDTNGWSTTSLENSFARAAPSDGVNRRGVRLTGVLRVNNVVTPNRTIFVTTDHRFVCSASTNAQGIYECSTWTTEMSAGVFRLSLSEMQLDVPIPQDSSGGISVVTQDLNVVTTDLEAQWQTEAPTMSYDTLETRNVTIRNLGAGAAAGVTARVFVIGLTQPEVSSTVASCQRNTEITFTVVFDCVAPTLAPATALNLEVRGTPDDRFERAELRVDVRSQTYDTTVQNNNKTAIYTFVDNSPPTDLRVSLESGDADIESTLFVRNLTLENLGASSARRVVLLVGGTNLQQIDMASYPDGVVFSGYDSNGKLRLSIDTLAGNSSLTLPIRFSPFDDATNMDVLVTVSSRTPESDVTNNTATQTYHRIATTDLYIDPLSSFALPYGETKVIPVEVYNTAVLAENVRVVFTITGMAERDIASTQGNCGPWNGDVLVCTLDELGTNESVRFDLNLRPDEAASRGSVRVEVSSDTPERTPDDLITSAEYTFTNTLLPDVIPSIEYAGFVRGAWNAALIRVGNPGVSIAQQIHAHITASGYIGRRTRAQLALPSGVTCGEWIGNDLSCTIDSLEVGGTRDLHFEFKPDPAQDQGTISVTLTLETQELDTTNNTSAFQSNFVVDWFLSVVDTLMSDPSLSVGGFIWRRANESSAGVNIYWQGVAARPATVRVRLTRLDGSTLLEEVRAEILQPNVDTYVTTPIANTSEPTCVVVTIDDQTFSPRCEES
ncbi:MAG: hypothetical protein HC933_09540 [Pleurocapsa sp. SU_196_0]|nr:hypothetical protein [Pleurocapsa sp. SU_196_0]